MNAPPTSGRGPRRFGWPQRVFSQVLLMQLTIITGVTILVTGLFLAPSATSWTTRRCAAPSPSPRALPPSRGS